LVIHPQVTQLNGIVSVTLTAAFEGDGSDVTDKMRISAYGDPKVNLGGQYTDPANTEYIFSFPATELYVGITTQLQNYTARFMTALPLAPQGRHTTAPGFNPPYDRFNNCGGSNYGNYPYQQGQLDCITTNPVEAATVWAAAIQTACLAAMTTLRTYTPPQLNSLPDSTI
jgi:hypothetical protein